MLRVRARRLSFVFLASFLFAATSALPSPAQAGVRPDLSAEDRQKLEAGEVLTTVESVEGGVEGLIEGRAVGLIDSPPDKVWPLIDQCARYQDFMPRVIESRELSRSGNTVECYVKIDMPFPLTDLWSKTRAVHDRVEDGGYRRTWHFYEGSYKVNEGHWIVLPWTPERHRTLLLYRLKAATELTAPKAIMRGAQRRAIPNLYESIRKRAKL